MLSSRLPRVLRGSAGLRRGSSAVVLIAALVGVPSAGANGPPLIAAAASLRFALPELAARFAEDGGGGVEISFGSSGSLARQILRGAPYDLFLSADESYVDMLVDRGAAGDRGVVYAVGRLALFLPRHSPLSLGVPPGDEVRELVEVLDDPRLERLAIANPRHAPYGRAAREALREIGIWERLEPHLVIGENVAQAAQFTLTEAVQAGLIAHSLAVSPAFAEKGTYALVPASLHRPLRNRMVLLPGAGETARRFYAFMTTPPAQAILVRFGFAAGPP